MRLLPVNDHSRLSSEASGGASPLAALEAFEAPQAQSFRSFRVGQSFFSAQVAGKFNVGRWVEVDLKANSVVVVYEAMLMSDREDPPQIVDDEVWINKYGAGIRIELSVQDVSANMQLDAYSVALAINAGMTRCGYRYTLLGGALSPGLVLPPVGMYDTTTYETLLDAVEATRVYMAKNAASLSPVLTHVYGGTPAKSADLHETQSVFAGVGAVRDLWTEQSAIVQAQKSGLSVNAVRAAYRIFAPGLPSTQKPNQHQSKAARDWWEQTNP